MDSFTVTKPCDHCLGHKYCIGIGGFKSVCGNCGGTGHIVVVKIQTLEEVEAEHLKEEKVINALVDDTNNLCSQRLVFPIDNPNDKPTKLICKKGRPKGVK